MGDDLFRGEKEDTRIYQIVYPIVTITIVRRDSHITNKRHAPALSTTTPPAHVWRCPASSLPHAATSPTHMPPALPLQKK